LNICILTSSFPAHPDDVLQVPFVIPLIRGLRRRGHRVWVFTQDRSGLKEEFLEEVHVRWFSWMGSKKPLVHLSPYRPLDLLRIGSLLIHGRRAIVPFLKDNRVEACLALWVVPSGIFAHHAFRKMGIPYSVWALGSDITRYGKNPLLSPVMRRIIRKARGVFADGFDLAKKVEERFGRRCDFLATTRLLEAAARQEALPGHPYRFLFVGRLEKVKGLDLLLRAMALLGEEGTPVHLTVCGAGGMEAWAKEFVRAEGLETKVSFTGSVDDRKLASLYASCDTVVIPSRSESIPLVFSEALQFNKPLIVADVGDMGMLGRDYDVACVVPPEDPMALKESMKRAIASRQEGEAGRGGKRAELLNRFNIETSVERFLADYIQ
jgi:glycosyltransferase involved in cell wall biosynthesis